MANQRPKTFFNELGAIMARDVAKAILEGIRRKKEEDEGRVLEGKDVPGERDGSGPFKGSARGSVSDVGRRKASGEECPNEDSEMQMYATEPSGAMGESGSPYSAYAADADVIGDGYSMLQIMPGRQWWVFDDSSQMPVVAIEAGHVSDPSGGWKPTSDLKVKGWRGGELDGTFASIDEAKAAALEALRSGKLGGGPKQVGVSTDVGVDEPGVRGDTRDPTKPGNLDESEWMSLDEMELTCVECADKMRDRKMTAILRREAQECIAKFGAKKDSDEG